MKLLTLLIISLKGLRASGQTSSSKIQVVSRNPQEYQIYYHVGLGKAASTYLQNRIFPALDGIRYIHRDRYRRYRSIIDKSHDDRYLVSREAAFRLDQRLEEFATFRSDAKVILVLRRHDRWIASHYRRYVKNGGSLSFDKYVDLDSASPLIWDKKKMSFFAMIQKIENRFGSKPLVLFHENLQNDPFQLIDQLCRFTGATYRRERIDLSVVHRSWNDKQLKFSKMVGRYLFSEVPKAHSHAGFNRVQRRLKLWACYAILGVARLIPKRFLGDAPLIPPEDLERIRQTFLDDWEACQQYAEINNPKLNAARSSEGQNL